MRTNASRILHPLTIAAALLLALHPSIGRTQIVIKTNALVSYAYDATNAFLPGEPLTTASGGLSTFSFFPTAFSASSSGGAPATNSITGLVGLDMATAAGAWFDGALSLSLNTKVNYSLTAPTATSSAMAEFSAPFTLEVTGVDGSPFVAPGLPIATNMPITPPSVSASGPVAFPSGSLSGSITLDINTIKLHFGIAPGSNVTAMRLQVSPLLTVQSEKGSATASLVNFDVVNQVVPEPSTYALLLTSGAAGLLAWQRRRRS